MNAKKFSMLDVNKRAALVWDKGEYIGYREYYGYKRVLYLVSKLYIEVWYFIATNKIEKVQIIENKADLEKYVDIKDILKEMFKPSS
jgi:hypothetical protein